jgi:acetyl esterase/lipase
MTNILTPPTNPGQPIVSKMPIVLTILTSLVNFWSVVPAPTMTLLPLSVSAPELSIWLLGLSSIGLTGYAVYWRDLPKIVLYLGVTFSIINISISATPAIELSGTIDRANLAMTKAFGDSYVEQISPQVRSTFLAQPFSLATTVRGINSNPIRIQRNIQFAAPAGVPLTINLYQPPTPGKYPAVIQIYGGAWRFGTPDSNEEFSRYLAARGYVVVAIDYRHAPSYRFPDQLTDIHTALDYMRQQAVNWEIDLDRIAAIGRSAGGHLATLTAYQPNALPFKAVVSYYGPVDLTRGYTNPPTPDPIDSRRVLRDFLGGTPADLPKVYRQASPYELVDRPLPPTLLVYGSKDRIVEARFGKQLADKLRSFGTPTVYIELPWANHAFDAIFNGIGNQIALYYTERFLAQTLR